MSTYYLINRIPLGTRRLLPGALIDSNQEDTAAIEAAGGLLIASSDTTIANAAAIAQQLSLRGQHHDASFIMMAAATKSASGDDVVSNLASVASGKGSALIGDEDQGGFTAQTTVNGQLQEIYQHLKSGFGVIRLLPNTFWLATGAPLAVFADGATAVPGSYAVASSTAVRWNNHATPNAIQSSFIVPPDLDATVNGVMHLRAAKAAQLGDLPTFTVGLFNQVDGALYDADSDFGGVSSAMTDAAAKTVQNVTRTIALADWGAALTSSSVTIKPTAGTLGSDDLLFFGAYILYKTKLRNA